ncbi:hypothetical protein ACWCW7_17775 [Nocardia tengchongensis]
MSISYDFETSIMDVASLAARFAKVLGCEPVQTQRSDCYQSDQWQISTLVYGEDEVEDYLKDRLQISSYVTVIFRPMRGIGWEKERFGIALLLREAIAILRDFDDAAGVFVFYADTTVLEKKRYGPVVASPKLLAAGSCGDFSDVIYGLVIESLE